MEINDLNETEPNMIDSSKMKVEYIETSPNMNDKAIEQEMAIQDIDTASQNQRIAPYSLPDVSISSVDGVVCFEQERRLGKSN